MLLLHSCFLFCPSLTSLISGSVASDLVFFTLLVRFLFVIWAVLFTNCDRTPRKALSRDVGLVFELCGSLPSV